MQYCQLCNVQKNKVEQTTESQFIQEVTTENKFHWGRVLQLCSAFHFSIG